MSGRLTSVFSKVVKSDETSASYERNLMGGDVSLLIGFEFNAETNLNNVFFDPYDVSLTQGVGEVTIGPFNSQNIRKPDGATHAQFVSVAGFFDFNGLASSVATAEGEPFELDGTVQEETTLTAGTVDTIEGGIGVVMLGLLFRQEVNGKLYKLNNGAKNALRIVSVE